MENFGTFKKARPEGFEGHKGSKVKILFNPGERRVTKVVDNHQNTSESIGGEDGKFTLELEHEQDRGYAERLLGALDVFWDQEQWVSMSSVSSLTQMCSVRL